MKIMVDQPSVVDEHLERGLFIAREHTPIIIFQRHGWEAR